MIFSQRITDSIAQCCCVKVWLSITLFLIVSASAQALDPHKAITQYRHDFWRVENGLPQNSIYAIAQTPDGYLWLGTSAGLVRFDGLRFTTFDNSNSNAIRRNTISRLFTDRSGNLWIDTLSGGIIRYKDGQFHSITAEHGLPEGAVTAWCQDDKGVFWIATLTYAGLMQWRDNKFIQALPIERMPKSPILTMTVDRQGVLWLGTREAGLLRFKDDQLTAFRMTAGKKTEGLPDDKVNSLYEDRKGDLWIGTDKGVCKWSQGKITREGIPASLLSGRISALNGDRDGNLWITVPGTGFYRLYQGQEIPFTEKNGLTNNTVTTFFEAQDGGFWVGTTGGLNRFRDGVFTTFTTAEGLPTDDAGSISFDARGGLWLAPTNGGLYRYQNGGYQTFRHDGLANDRIYTLVKSRTDGLWLGRQSGGLTYLDINHPEQNRTYTERDGLPQSNIYTVYEDRDGTVWLGTVTGALCRFRDGKFTTFTSQDGFTADAINSILQDPQGNLLIGTNKGLIRFAAGKFTTFTTKEGLVADDVKCLYLDSSGVIWIGTGAGLTRLKNGQFASIRAKEGLFDESILSLIEDAKKNLWFSGAKGIFRTALQELNEVAEGQRKYVTSVAYNSYDGLRSTEVAAGKPAAIRSDDGRLWFATSRGIALTDPSQMPFNRIPPSLQIESLIADHESLPINGAITIKPGVERLEIIYTGINLLIPERVQFKFKLEGYDKDWIEVGTRRVAIYPHLSPGTYRFRVIACNNDGVWNEIGAETSFRVRPFFYQTYPFYLLCVALLALSVWGVHRLQIKQVRASFALVLAERVRVAREIHDTLLQGFTGISLKLDAITQQLPSESKAKQQLEAVLEQADQALTEARRAVWDMRSPLIESQGLASALAASAKQIVAGTPAQLQFVVEGTSRDLPPAVEDNLLRICQEAVNNAIKHAAAKQINVTLKYERRQVQLQIKDDGRGFDVSIVQTAKSEHFGLLGMQERAKKMGGQLILNSTVDAGTQVSALIPVE